ncbi:MAG TPA: Tm-1-like ATP-binding domain-containing protein, partial [Thermomicrobiales bacterium]|nr:Tm-1-like ATP-binding domain-containing protein [Thermomicrobiales bacterium]
MTKTVAVVAALDTKGDEAQLIKRVIESQGVNTLLIDVGVLGAPTIPADVSRADVAAAGGGDVAELVSSQDKGRAMATMTRGAAAIASRLYGEGRFDGIIGLGGTAGTAIGSSAMRALPVGVPKLLVSTVASGD